MDNRISSIKNITTTIDMKIMHSMHCNHFLERLVTIMAIMFKIIIRPMMLLLINLNSIKVLHQYLSQVSLYCCFYWLFTLVNLIDFTVVAVVWVFFFPTMV